MWDRKLILVVLLVSLLAVTACDDDSGRDGDAGSAGTSGTGSPSRSQQDDADEAPDAGGAPVYVGARPGIPVEAVPLGDRPVRPAVLETRSDALVVGLRWRDWGGPVATGRGMARINSCEPNCASGEVRRHPGVVATLEELRSGACRGRPARFYSRAVVKWPPGLSLPSEQTFELLPRCIEVG
jgi:hypothetical protein